MKKIIRIENQSINEHKVVDWKLHNVCNYDCSFCHINSKGGDQRFLEAETYFAAANKLMASTEAENKKCRFFLTGGEPTLLPVLPELIARIKKRGHYVRMNTNGGRTIRWWTDFIDLCDGNNPDYIVLSAHIEQNCDLDHLIKITELYKNYDTIILCSVTAPPYNWENSIAAQQYLIDHSISYVHLRGIFKLNNKLMNYTQDQIEKLKTDFIVHSKRLNEKTIKLDRSHWQELTAVYNDGSQEVHNGQFFVNAGISHFFGYNCTIGQHRLLIDYKTVYKGACKQDGAIGDIYNFDFAKSPTVCTKNGCMCGADVLQPKWKNS